MSDERRPVADRVADVVFYGPLGFALDCRTLLPQLAKRGRRQIAFTRTIGRFTVRQGRERLDGVVGALPLGPLIGQTQSPAPTASSPPESAPADVPAAEALPDDRQPSRGAGADHEAASAADLAIPQYDSLSAIQVVPRLEGLSAAELDQIAAYETATRRRRTILAKVSQLRG